MRRRTVARFVVTTIAKVVNIPNEPLYTPVYNATAACTGNDNVKIPVSVLR